MSRQSRARMLVKALACGIKWQSMLVLTYGDTYPSSGKDVKKHLNVALGRLRRLRSYASYFWWLEFQKRGAPHIHILVNFEPDYGDRVKIAKTWVKSLGGLPGASGGELERVFAVHIHPKAWQVEHKPGGLAHDVALYATKPHQKSVPKRFQNVGRWWGASRDVQPIIVAEFPVDGEAGARLLLEATEHRCANWDVIPKFIFGFPEFEDLTEG